jgi:hypothetical protein
VRRVKKPAIATIVDLGMLALLAFCSWLAWAKHDFFIIIVNISNIDHGG